MLLSTPSLLAGAILSGCVNGAVNAPSTAIVNVPEDFAIAFSESWNGQQDGQGLVLLADISVYDQAQELPLEKVAVDIISGWAGVYVIPEQAVLTVDFPSVPDDFQENYNDYCYDEYGEFDPTQNEWCAWYYDDSAGVFYQIGNEYADAGGYAPNYFRATTDNRGLVRVFMYVDMLPSPSTGGSYADVHIYASIGVDTQSFAITSQ